MNKKAVAIAGVLIAGVVGAFALTNKKDVTPESNVASESSMTITHSLGETIVEKNPERVVVFDIPTLDTMEVLGIDNVVGVPTSKYPENLDKYNSDDYETEEDYDEAMEHYEEYSEGIINFTWKDDYNYCLLGGLSFRIIDGEVIFTSVINKSDEESPEYSEDDYYFNPYLSDNFKCCAQIIKTIEAVLE